VNLDQAAGIGRRKNMTTWGHNRWDPMGERL